MPRVVINVPDLPPQPYRFAIDREHITVGQAETNDIIINSPSISRNHCRIERVEGGYIMRDLDSTNGIKQGELSLTVLDLFNESEVLIGDIPLVFQLSDEETEIINKEEFTSQLQYSLPKSSYTPDENVEAPSHEPPVHELPSSSDQPTPQTNTAPAVIKNTDKAGSISLGTLALAALALFVGMCIRHQKDTGEFLLTKIVTNLLS